MPLDWVEHARTLLPREVFRRIEFLPEEWVWLGERFPSDPYNDGYGLISIGGKSQGAHRFVYQCLVEQIPKGMQLDHGNGCLTTLCVYPVHLEVVSPGENQRRGRTSERNHQRQKSCCPRGHPYSGVNSRGDRICHKCLADQARVRNATS